MARQLNFQALDLIFKSLNLFLTQAWIKPTNVYYDAPPPKKKKPGKMLFCEIDLKSVTKVIGYGQILWQLATFTFQCIRISHTGYHGNSTGDSGTALRPRDSNDKNKIVSDLIANDNFRLDATEWVGMVTEGNHAFFLWSF